MSVPKFTIPESAYDPSTYSLKNTKSKSGLLTYLLKLTNGGSLALIVSYFVGFFIVKPLLETSNSRRLEFLETMRSNLREIYLKMITKVSYIPIVAIKRNGKLHADAIVQTESHPDKSAAVEDRLSQGELHQKMVKMSSLLNTYVKHWSMENFSNYKGVNYAVKDLQNKSDLVYFDDQEFFTLDTGLEAGPNGGKARKRNIVVDTKNEIRSIKGLYMSGQV
ncbi:hypothetical protein CANMA_000339 [Candida margitis]|uniref:uncharacterized protein n=1 Tax=Candida margitis TaxID=1775924 RepID=UPI0022274486|nr:uncharacterized protein CANMA_000339 [Candida margitis]KAI5970598.1 hypothetical protein CANMA_000339 [Candida margitis]